VKHLINLPSTEKFPNVIFIGLLIALLAGGYLLGNVVNTVLPFQTSPSSDPVVDSRPSSGAIVNPPYQVQDFTLTSHTGEPLSLSDLRGKAVLMFFGYTHCPDICPTTLADYRRVKNALGDDADEVAFVFISVDGARDTPEVLAAYLGRFDSEFTGLTGDETVLQQIGSEYGLIFQQETINVEHEHEAGYEHEPGDDLQAENYFVQHTSPSFLIDRDGYLRMVFFYSTKPSAITEGIRELLQE